MAMKAGLAAVLRLLRIQHCLSMCSNHAALCDKDISDKNFLANKEIFNYES